MLFKRGGANPAATLVGLITLVFVLYILFLPPDARQELLDEGTITVDGEDSDTSTLSEKQVLLSEPVGRLSFVSRSQFDHPLPNTFLTEKSDASVLKSENPFLISKGWFGEDRKVMRFDVPDKENTENIFFNFQAPVRNGKLNIMLNGDLILSEEVASQNPAPIRLSKSMLQETNTIVFFVTGGFFEKKEYGLADVKVVGEISDRSKQVAEHTFSLSQSEIENFDAAHFNFYPLCQQAKVGHLTIELNGRTIHSSTPACESLNRQELYVEDLVKGKNALRFKIDKGSHRIEQMLVRVFVKPVKTHINYFNVESDLFVDIQEGRRDVVMKIEFVDDGKIKHAETNVNGIRDIIDQRATSFNREISGVVREGNNYVEIRPLTDLDVVSLDIRAE